VIHAYLVYNIAVKKQLGSIASLIKVMLGNRISLIYSTHCINKAILFSRSNGVDHFNKEVLNGFDGQNKIIVYSILCNHLRRCIFSNGVFGHAKHIPVYEFKQWYGYICFIIYSQESAWIVMSISDYCCQYSRTEMVCGHPMLII
jgi:hypothetical protein